MAQVTATIASKVGLHARPAETYVTAVGEMGVTLTNSSVCGPPLEATSIMAVLTMGRS